VLAIALVRGGGGDCGDPKCADAAATDFARRVYAEAFWLVHNLINPLPSEPLLARGPHASTSLPSPRSPPRSRLLTPLFTHLCSHPQARLVEHGVLRLVPHLLSSGAALRLEHFPLHLPHMAGAALHDVLDAQRDAHAVGERPMVADDVDPLRLVRVLCDAAESGALRVALPSERRQRVRLVEQVTGRYTATR